MSHFGSSQGGVGTLRRGIHRGRLKNFLVSFMGIEVKETLDLFYSKETKNEKEKHKTCE